MSHWWAKQRRGGNISPYEDIRGKNQIGASELCFFQSQSRISRARFTPKAISSYWGTIVRLGELVLMLENLVK